MSADNQAPPVGAADLVASAAFAAALARARHKAYRRIIPLVFFAYVIAYIDRSNVAICKLAMEKSLGWGNDIFGNGGVFFLGYFLLEIPGALIVERWSARKWVSRIMITWGIIAALQALVTTPNQFYAGRFFLGLAEAGFFPGIVVYLNHWFPARDRARALALFIMAAPVAQIISPPLSMPLLKFGTTEMIDGTLVTHPLLFGLEGWQWVYIVWGLPAVIFGVVVLFAMTDRPSQARWLADDERAALEAELARERQSLGTASTHGAAAVWAAMRDPRVLLLAATNFSVVCGHYGVDLFLATILRDWYGLSLSAVGWLVPLPFVATLIGQLAVSTNSDRTQERWWHTAMPMFIGAAALLAAPFTRGSLVLTLLVFALALAGIRSYLPPFFALPRLFLGGTAAAGSIGLINAVGNLGGFVGPFAIGHIQHATGSFRGGLFFLAATAALAGSIVVFLRQWHLRQQRRLAGVPVGLSDDVPAC